MDVKRRKFALVAGVVALFLLAAAGVYAYCIEPVWVQIRDFQETRGLRLTDYERDVFKQCDGCRPVSVKFSCNGTDYDFPLPAGSTPFENADFPGSEESLQYMARSDAFGAWVADMDERAPNGFEYEQMGSGYSFIGKDDRTLVHIGESSFGRNYSVFYFYPIERIPNGPGGYTFRDILPNSSAPSREAQT